MPGLTPPIDYAATRAALVKAVAQATGLPPGHVLRAQAQGPVQPPPGRPYCSFTYRLASLRTGFRDQVVYAPDLGPTMWRYRGARGIALDLNFYADDQDVAYTLASSLQAALAQAPTRATLAAAGCSVWQIGDVTDVTALVGTGYEARALLEFQMWLGFNGPVDLGTIEQVSVRGDVHGEAGDLQAELIVQTTEG